MSQNWRKAWRLNRYGAMIPEQVEIMDVGQQYVLVKGEEHTVYRGNFHASKVAAFTHAIEEEELHLRSSERRLKQLREARDRHA
jgi:hypothetical protein